VTLFFGKPAANQANELFGFRVIRI